MNILFVSLLTLYLVQSIAMHRQTGPEAEAEETQIHRGMPAPLMPITLFFAVQAFSTPAIMQFLAMPAVWAAGGLLLLMVLLGQLKKRQENSDGIVARFFYISGGLMQTVLLCTALYMAFREGVLGRSLFDPKWVILGLLAGHLIFGISLIFSHRSLDSLGDIAAYVVDLRLPGRFLGQSPRQLFACLDVSLIEELIYRVAAQSALVTLTGSVPIAIAVTALVFSMVHRHFFYNHIVDSLEFLAFSLLLGVLYHFTGSLMLVVVIHTVRNFEIVYFDHATRHDTAVQGRLTSEKA